MMRLFISLLIPVLTGLIGSVFTTSALSTWYAGLNKPLFTPPNWAFAPIWLTLYSLMGVALYINWREKTDQAKFNVQLFFVHLLLNFLWTPVFFGAKDIFLALEIIIALWAIIVVMIDNFWNVNRTSALILFPYLLWVTYAAFLNYFIWRLN